MAFCCVVFIFSFYFLDANIIPKSFFLNGTIKISSAYKTVYAVNAKNMKNKFPKVLSLLNFPHK